MKLVTRDHDPQPKIESSQQRVTRSKRRGSWKWAHFSVECASLRHTLVVPPTTHAFLLVSRYGSLMALKIARVAKRWACWRRNTTSKTRTNKAAQAAVLNARNENTLERKHTCCALMRAAFASLSIVARELSKDATFSRQALPSCCIASLTLVRRRRDKTSGYR